MKKCVTAVLAACIMMLTVLPLQAGEPIAVPPVIGSEAVVLMDAGTGQILFEKNMHQCLYPASITKIMTVLLGIEHAPADDVVTMSHDAVFSLKLGAAHIALDEGEQITMEQALMAAMLPSANDACNGIAEHISGSIPAFVELMNRRAAQAGALNTTFANTNGLYDPRHLTTAYDMAMITRDAIQNPQFRRIFGTSYYVIGPTNKQPETRYLWAEHKMFECGRYEYQGVIGGKTGYTRESGNTLVTLARRGERELLVVAIRSLDHAVYSDTAALLDYGFEQFEQRPLALPAVTLADMGGSPGAASLTGQADRQVEALEVSRLLHKSISPDDISISYTLLNPSESVARVRLDMRLGTGTDLMYADLGSVLVELPVQIAAGGPVLRVLAIILKLLAAAAITAFALRWYFHTRRALRRRRGGNLNPDRIRLR